MIVIHGGREDVVNVQVKPPIDGSVGPVEVGSDGAAVQGAGGHLIGFGPGQARRWGHGGNQSAHRGSATHPGAAVYDFWKCVQFGRPGSDVTGALQVAVPVDDTFAPGDEVFFFRQIQFPNEQGELIDYWAVIDSGQSRRRRFGSIDVAAVPWIESARKRLDCQEREAAEDLRIELDWIINPSMVFLPALGFAGLALWTAQVIIPVGIQAADLQVWQQWGDMAVPALQVINVGADTTRIRARVPDPPANVVGDPPILEDLHYEATNNQLTIRGDKFVDVAGETKVIFTFGSKRVEMTPQSVNNNEIVLTVPSSVLIGTAKITVERSFTQSTNSPNNQGGVSILPLTSEPGQIINQAAMVL